MSTIKLSVTIELPGSQMMTSQECDENPQVNYERHRLLLSVKHFDRKTKKSFYRTEPLEFTTRKCAPAKQCINMSEEAYEYMTSIACPDWFPFGISRWRKLTPQERLEMHLERTCKSLGGKSYTYAVFGD